MQRDKVTEVSRYHWTVLDAEKACAMLLVAEHLFFKGRWCEGPHRHGAEYTLIIYDNMHTPPRCTRVQLVLSLAGQQGSVI